MITFIVFRLPALRRKSFILYENDYIQWLLSLFYRLFGASLSESDDFVLSDGDLYANVLCNVPVSHTSLI